MPKDCSSLLGECSDGLLDFVDGIENQRCAFPHVGGEVGGTQTRPRSSAARNKRFGRNRFAFAHETETRHIQIVVFQDFVEIGPRKQPGKFARAAFHVEKLLA